MPRAARSQQFLIDPLAVTRDPVRRAMGPAAQGVYDTLWLESWMEKVPGVLPGSESVLARLAQVSDEIWKMVVDEVRTGFDVSAQRWVCRAVLRTKREQDSWRTHWRKQKQAQRLRGADKGRTSATTSSDGTGSGSGTGSGTEIQKKPPTPARAARLAVVVFDPLAMPLPDWLPAGAWADWCAHRREKRQRLTERAARLCFAKLAEFREDGHDPKSVLEQSIAGGWTGLFALKGTVSANGHAPPAGPAKPTRTRQWCHHCGGSERWVPSPAPSMYLCDDCTQEARR